MTEDLKQHVTKGAPFEIDFSGNNHYKQIEIFNKIGSGVAMVNRRIHIAGVDGDTKYSLETHANAHLITEAFTVFSETGMTPREMMEMLKEAYEALPFGSATRDKINHALKMYDNLDQH